MTHRLFETWLYATVYCTAQRRGSDASLHITEATRTPSMHIPRPTSGSLKFAYITLEVPVNTDASGAVV